MRRPLSRHTRRVFAALFVAAPLVFATFERAAAQSSDITFPAPVFSNEIAGRITPRDLGDSRLTRHFYLFKGTEGDVTVTVEGAQLNGDVDLFVAKTLRPLLKVTLFGGSATKATKSVYLRREETLILRVEARAVGDAEGTYRILLGGSFAPAPPELAQAVPAETPGPSPEASPRRGTRRVTATGARIDEPPPPVVAEATPTPEATPAEPARAEESTAAPARPTRRGRNTRGTTGRRRAPAARPTPTPTESPAGETAARPTEETPRPEEPKPEGETATPADRPPANTSRRRGSRASNRRRAPAESSTEAAAAPADPTPSAPPPAVTITRLVILTKDGQTLERDMNTVRRVTIENNQIVVTLRDGKVVRTPLATVEKMSFEP